MATKSTTMEAWNSGNQLPARRNLAATGKVFRLPASLVLLDARLDDKLASLHMNLCMIHVTMGCCIHAVMQSSTLAVKSMHDLHMKLESPIDRVPASLVT
jgi:hypothetical protein